MLLEKQTLEEYLDEIEELHHTYLHEDIVGVRYFGIIEHEELQAVSSVKCYSGHWYLRSCVVKPEHRGNGLQQRLIRERLEYLAARTDTVRVSVRPDNIPSIRNIEREGFVFEKTRQLKNGIGVNVYKRHI